MRPTSEVERNPVRPPTDALIIEYFLYRLLRLELPAHLEREIEAIQRQSRAQEAGRAPAIVTARKLGVKCCETSEN